MSPRIREQEKDWTENSAEDYLFDIAAGFSDKIEDRLDELGMTQAGLAEKLGVTPGRVSQLINNPGNLSLKTMVRWARAVGLKLTVFPYDDGDSENFRGPVDAHVFLECWRMAGKPKDGWDLEKVPDCDTCPGIILR
jgi:transcriptional regulator with XRE-family HTH domain